MSLVLVLAACKMLSTSEWIYLDLEKSGCTFLRAALQRLFAPECFVNMRKHSLMSHEVGLPKIMTIRHPCEYYFSLWRYGLDGHGGFLINFQVFSLTFREKCMKRRLLRHLAASWILFLILPLDARMLPGWIGCLWVLTCIQRE